MRVLYGKMLSSNNPKCMSALRNIKADYTYYSEKEGGLFVPVWGNVEKIVRKSSLIPFLYDIKITNKTWKEQEVKELWKKHPEIWLRKI